MVLDKGEGKFAVTGREKKGQGSVENKLADTTGAKLGVPELN